MRPRERAPRLDVVFSPVDIPLLARCLTGRVPVERDLPKKREYLVYTPLTAAQRTYYEAIVNRDIRSFLLSKAKGGSDGAAAITDVDADVAAADAPTAEAVADLTETAAVDAAVAVDVDAAGAMAVDAAVEDENQAPVRTGRRGRPPGPKRVAPPVRRAASEPKSYKELTDAQYIRLVCDRTPFGGGARGLSDRV